MIEGCGGTLPWSKFRRTIRTWLVAGNSSFSNLTEIYEAMDTLVAGIDQSARRTGVCILNQKGAVVSLELIVPKKRKDQLRLVFIRDELNALLGRHSISVIVMEGYSYGSMNKPFILGEIGGVIKLVVHDQGAKLYTAAPKQLKKFVTGRGSVDKEAIIKGVARQWNIDVGAGAGKDDKADAVGLAHIAREIVWPTSTRRYQLDVIKSIMNKDLHKPKSKGIKALRDAL